MYEQSCVHERTRRLLAGFRCGKAFLAQAKMATPTPPESLVQYGEPIFTGETLDPPKKVPGVANSGSASNSITAAAVVAAASESSGSATNGKADGVARVEDILNAVLPPQYVSRPPYEANQR
jgi:hypothetical protein